MDGRRDCSPKEARRPQRTLLAFSRYIIPIVLFYLEFWDVPEGLFRPKQPNGTLCGVGEALDGSNPLLCLISSTSSRRPIHNKNRGTDEWANSQILKPSNSLELRTTCTVRVQSVLFLKSGQPLMLHFRQIEVQHLNGAMVVNAAQRGRSSPSLAEKSLSVSRARCNDVDRARCLMPGRVRSSLKNREFACPNRHFGTPRQTNRISY